MKTLLTTSRLAVLVNGIPGPWISCKRGLRQGDALSPYLFIIMAHVLQQLIKSNNGIRHSMTDGACPVLQYADDTIILVRAEPESVQRLKRALDLFSAATELTINFTKSTVTPMHVPEDDLQEYMGVLLRRRGSFPRPTLVYRCPTSSYPCQPLILLLPKSTGTWRAGRHCS